MAWDVKNMLHEKSLDWGLQQKILVNRPKKRDRHDAASLAATIS